MAISTQTIIAPAMLHLDLLWSLGRALPETTAKPLSDGRAIQMKETSPQDSKSSTHIATFTYGIFRLYGINPKMLLRHVRLLRCLQSGTVSRTTQRLTCSASPQTLHLIFASDPAAPPQVGP
ncbi:hypothetical protein BDP55DRAFT_82756 [Colletotrichum godetiae]|uniref:Uncharacterized protein n=1 Tax=Colletotrichum godetiae TaxID=1209918 RepID=A0AAJ0AT45_9PEZI|nr:uncharacterized protein BDP55DRAFT_82756 [Colletotrichum godetiae]KAK1687634.1 hypothetical protein BDP55DRAFT_82756 [Colletotrichum godetiae]